MKLKFGKFEYEAEVRRGEELRDVLRDPQTICEDFDAYYIFRDVYEDEEDRESAKRAGVRYDITIIPSRIIGEEYIKTYGHYHPKMNAHTYPELYQVLEGEAIFLLQLPYPEDRRKIADALAIRASSGDVVLVPPDYGHVTINPSNSVLKLANLVARDFSSVYDDYKRMRGACYYFLTPGRWVTNPNYLKVPELRQLNAVRLEFLDVSEIYDLIHTPQKVFFLRESEGCLELARKLYGVSYEFPRH